MKKIITLILLILTIGGAASALDLGLGFYMDLNSFEEISNAESFNSLSDIAFLAFRIDVPLGRKMGLLIEPGVRFEEIAEGSSSAGFNQNIHWNAQVGPVYHFFGYRSFLDPFAGVGIGTSGAVYFDDENYADWQTMVQLSIFLYANAGVNIVLDDSFYVGLSAQVNAYEFNPSPLATYAQSPFGVRVSFGVRM